MKKVKKDLKEEVEKELGRLLGFIDKKSIITHDKIKGLVFIGGEMVTDPSRLSNLKSEADFILNSDLWKIISETITYMAHQRMFIKSETFDDLLSGKMWLYHVSIQKEILDILKSYRPVNNDLAFTSKK